jgi:CheY-like chemotaxis protein
VLLVDDNRDGLLVRKAILEEQQFTITTATNGEDAIEAYTTKGKFDLVVTDFRMPKMDGIELIRRIRAIEPEQPIILVSGFVDPLGLDEKSTGADAVVNKGAHEIPHLLRAITRLLARRTPKRPQASQKRAAARAKSV